MTIPFGIRRSLFVVTTLVLTCAGWSATFAVTSDLDDGSVGTLRWAIGQANGAAGADIITIPAITITLTSALPTISQALEINGAGKDATIVQASAAYWEPPSPGRRVFHVSAPTTLRDLTARHGSSAAGGGILASAPLTMERVAVRRNVSSSDSSGASGGGIYSTSSLTATDCDIESNVAIYLGSIFPRITAGGGVYLRGSTVIMERCTIANNSAISVSSWESRGGGLALLGGAGGFSGNLRECTISGNLARAGGAAAIDGAGVYFEGTAANMLTLDSCAIVRNQANGTSGQGGGIYWSLGTDDSGPILRNCIVYGNEAATGPDLFNNIQSRGFNIVGSTAGATWDVAGGGGNTAVGNQIGVDPLLEGLGYYGGGTRTHRLLAGSPALDLGTDLDVAGVAFTIDQRGRPRVSNGTADIGPFELDSVAPTVAGGITLEPTTTTDRDAVVFHVTFDEALAAELTAGNVTLTGTLAGAATAAVEGTNPAFDVLVTMNNQYADGTIGVDLAGTMTDLEGNALALPVSSAMYTIRNVPGDTNDDGDVVAAELNTVVLWFRELLP